MKSLIVLAILCAFSAAMLIPREQRLGHGPWRPNVEFEEIPEDTDEKGVDVSEETTSGEKADEVVEAPEVAELTPKEEESVGKPSGYNVKPWKRGLRWMRKHNRMQKKEKQGCSLTELLSDFNEDDRLALHDILRNQELSLTEKEKEIREYGVESKNEDAVENLVKKLAARREQQAAERKTALDEITETFEKIEEVKMDMDLTKSEKYGKIEAILEEVGTSARQMIRVLYGKHSFEKHRKHFKSRIGKINVHHHNDHHQHRPQPHHDPHHGRRGHGY